MPKGSGRQTGVLPLLRQQPDRLFIEGNEGFSARPPAFVRHNAIREIAARFE
ncbi:MAG: hypothetical protein LBJ59_06940 [Zoogloeaceae bacterium]|nr:hypothetical protein [Zoogloeaceae bacterium]